MSNENSVTIIGNMTRDPEHVQASTGMAIAKWGMAVNKRTNRNGVWEDDVSFFDCVAFGDQAMNVIDSLRKGDRVIVVGEMKQSSWESDGVKRSKVEVVCNEVGPSLRWAKAEPSKVSLAKGVAQARESLASTDVEWKLGEEPF